MSEERYEIRGKIGQGGVGAVYRAYDTQLRREVAIKRVLADEGDGDSPANSELATKNLLKEATALSSVQHPHICTVYDAGIDKEGPYVVMELINGKTLDEMVERGTLTYDDFREVAIQSQEAMIAAQDLDLVHRDLKPSNVMVCWLPSGRFQVKLVDFGLAKFSAKPSLQTIDHGDAVFGSIFFMAPEQFERTPLDRRTDMYSLGCMYYYSLAGTYPFNGDSAPQVMASHLQNSVQPLQELRPDLPHWVCEWVMWHLARDMDHRPESARVALEKYLLDETTAAQGGGAMPQRTGPQLITPAVTAAHANRPAVASSTVGTKTAPQSIAPPAGSRLLTASQPVRPASAVTGVTAIQPARPYIAANAATSSATSSQAITAAHSPTTPQLHAEAGAAQSAAAKKKKIIIGLGAALGLAAVIAIGSKMANSDTDTYNALIEQVSSDHSAKEIPTSENDVEILLKALTDNDVKKKDYIYRRLTVAKADGNISVDQLIWNYTSKAALPPKTKEMLGKVMAKRANPEVLEQMLDFAVDNSDDPIAKIALKSANINPDEENFSKFIKILSNSSESNTRSAAENALKTVITSSSDKQHLTEQLLGAFDASIDKNYKLAMLRLLGTTGTNSAKNQLSSALKSSDSSERIAAAKAFSAWPNDTPFDDLLTAFIDESSATAKNNMFKSIINLLDAKRSHGSDLGSNWMQLAPYADTSTQKRRVINSAGKAKASWSKSVLDYFSTADHPQAIRDYAKSGLQQL